MLALKQKKERHRTPPLASFVKHAPLKRPRVRRSSPSPETTNILAIYTHFKGLRYEFAELHTIARHPGARWVM